MFRITPSMAVSLTALVLAGTGTAVAAVDFAANAGAVDGKSAVADGASLKAAAGKLVATQRSGDGRGRIAQKYLDEGLMRGSTSTFGRSQDVADNQVLAPVALGTVPGLGTLTTQCLDEARAAGVEDPLSRLTFANTSGQVVNLSRSVGDGAPLVANLANGAQTTFDIRGSNTFELHIEQGGTNFFVRGTVRQDGRGTAAASCLTYGFSIEVRG
jgi:hypothetical protein